MNELAIGHQPWDFRDAVDLIDEFMALYDRRPVNDNHGGMLSAHMFWVWYIARKTQPKYIIESGIFKGQSTWLFRSVCPDAKLFSIDPVLGQREFTDPETMYFDRDFSLIDWDELINDKEHTLCFFDDHQNAYSRLMQMRFMGFRQAIFEDNYPGKRGDCYSLNMVLQECGFTETSGWKTPTKKTIKHLLGFGNDVPANQAHSAYLKRNVQSYTVMPPLYRAAKTRWNDAWNDENGYYTPQALLDDRAIEKYPTIRGEATSYTWICYLQLK